MSPRGTAIRGAGSETGARLRGFTLLEVLLVIILLVMLTSVLVSGAIHLTRDKPLTPEDVFWQAVTTSRRAALLSGRDVRLTYVAKEKERALVAKTADGKELRHPFEMEGELTVDFLSTEKTMSAILIRGQLIETQTIPSVTFFGDGTCTPFRLQIRTGGAARIISIDPWTCAPVLVKAEQAR